MLPLLLACGAIILGNKVSRIFSVYAGLNYLYIAITNSVAITDEYGLGIIIGNALGFLVISLAWFWESILGENDLSAKKFSPLKYFSLLAALFVWWLPINLESMEPSFNPSLLITSSSGQFFCFITPFYLAVLLLFYPKVNRITFRITSFIGLIIGVLNVITNFVYDYEMLWWNGILHLPLFTIAAYCFLLSMKDRREKVKYA
jgi:hypothetical protein